VDGIELSYIKLKRVIHIVLTIRMALDCGKVSIGSAAAGGQQQASVVVFAESPEAKALLVHEKPPVATLRKSGI
jgi:hypothetical protein